MSRLIDADELSKAKFHSLPYTHIVPIGEKMESYERGWNDAIDAVISEAETVDAVPVVHGHWIWSDDLCEYCCSRCGRTDDYGIHPDIEYCPYCGALMDESTQSNDSNTLDAFGEKVKKDGII